MINLLTVDVQAVNNAMFEAKTIAASCTLEIGDLITALERTNIQFIELEAKITWRDELWRSFIWIATLEEGISDHVRESSSTKLVVGKSLQLEIIVALPDLYVFNFECIGQESNKHLEWTEVEHVKRLRCTCRSGRY